MGYVYMLGVILYNRGGVDRKENGKYRGSGGRFQDFFRIKRYFGEQTTIFEQLYLVFGS